MRTQVGNDLDGEAASDYFGFRVSLSTDGLVVAISPKYNGGSFQYAGHVRVLEWATCTSL